MQPAKLAAYLHYSLYVFPAAQLFGVISLQQDIYKFNKDTVSCIMYNLRHMDHKIVLN